MAGLMPADVPGRRLQGTDVQGFAAAVERTCGWVMAGASPDMPFSWHMHAIELNGADPRGALAVDVAILACSPGQFQVVARHPSDVMIVVPLRGRMVLDVDRRAMLLDQGQAIVCQGHALGGFGHEVADNDVSLGVVRLNFRSVEHILFDPLHLPIDPDLQLSATIDARSAETGGLFAMIGGLCSEGFIGQSRRASPRLQRNLIDGLSLMVLETLPHRYSERMLRPSVGPLPSYVRMAREFMHSAEGNTFSIADLAARAGVSVRTLELGFRTYLNITPAVYLRTVRLQRAHAFLKAGTDTRTVAEIARACGLSHAGRFADYYLQLFGETPSETRRRGEHPAL